jgi:hypothetical protein
VATDDFNRQKMCGIISQETLKEYHELQQAFDNDLWCEGSATVQGKMIEAMMRIYLPQNTYQPMRLAAILMPFYVGLILFWHMILPNVFSTRLGFPLEMIALFFPSNIICTILLFKGYQDNRIHLSAILRVFLVYLLLSMKMAIPGLLNIHMVSIPSILSVIYVFLLIWIQMWPSHFSGTRGLYYFVSYTMEVMNRSKDTYDAFNRMFTLQWEDFRHNDLFEIGIDDDDDDDDDDDINPRLNEGPSGDGS